MFQPVGRLQILLFNNRGYLFHRFFIPGHPITGLPEVLKEAQVQGPGYMMTVHVLALDKPGLMKPVEYDEMVLDLVNYMTYMSEPARHDRVRIGLYALIVLSVLIGLAYALKKEVWKDVH